MKDVVVLSQIDENEFINNYIVPNKPVILTAEMENWSLERFQPKDLQSEIGEHIVHVYDDLFNLVNLCPLKDYLKKNFFKSPGEDRSREYVRAYVKLADVDFEWANELFSKLSGAWHYPSCFPGNSMLVPYCSATDNIDPTVCDFPYKGLFVSGRGARTRLHRDPFNSNAILCQIYGKKKFLLYHPSKASLVMNGEDFVDPTDIDIKLFPEFQSISPDFEIELKAGECIFLPKGWFHDVTSMTDSISITWNFIHSSELGEFCRHVENNPSEQELEKLKYFWRDFISSDSSADEIVKVAKSLVF